MDGAPVRSMVNARSWYHIIEVAPRGHYPGPV